MKLIDSHCHIHESEFFSDVQQAEVYQRAIEAEVAMICVATSEAASQQAINFVNQHQDSWAVIGVHPHEAKNGCTKIGELLKQNHQKVIGIGEVGLDYFYENSARSQQQAVLEQHLQWAVDYKLPISFHVRDGFDDFWPIVDNFSGIRGVLHSFTDNQANLEQAYTRGLYIGVNGIATFTKDRQQQEIFARMPLDKVLLETDAPFLTPAPFRGRMNEPKFVERVAEHMASIRSIAPDLVFRQTTDNARRLFDI